MKSLKKILIKFLFISTVSIIAFVFYKNNIQKESKNEYSSITLMNQSKMENYLNKVKIFQDNPNKIAFDTCSNNALRCIPSNAH